MFVISTPLSVIGTVLKHNMSHIQALGNSERELWRMWSDLQVIYQ